MTKTGSGTDDILLVCIFIYGFGFVAASAHRYYARDPFCWVPGAFRRDICLMPLCPIVFLLPMVLWPIWYLPLLIWWAVRGLWKRADTCCGIKLSGIKNGINLSRFKKKKVGDLESGQRLEQQDGTELRDMVSNDGIGVRGTDNDAAHVQGQAYGKYVRDPPPVYVP